MKTPIVKTFLALIIFLMVSASASAFLSPIGSLFDTQPSEEWFCEENNLGDEVCVTVTAEGYSRDTIIPSDYLVAPNSVFDINLQIALYDFVEITSAELTMRRSGSSSTVMNVDFIDKAGFHIPGQLRYYYFSDLIAPGQEGEYIIEYRVRGRRSQGGSITTLGYSFERITVDSSASPTGQIACGYCEGDSFERLHLDRASLVPELKWWEKLLGVSREGVSGPMCDGNEYQGKNLHAWSTLTNCKAGQPVSNLEYFQPEIKNVYIQTGSVAQKLDIPDMASIPVDMLKEEYGFKEGEYVNIIVEVDNSRAKTFKESDLTESQISQLTAIAQDIREFPTVNPDNYEFVNWIQLALSDINPVVNLYHYLTDRMRSNRGPVEIDEARSQFIHAAPYLNHAILEVGFYSPNAAPEGYSYYSREGFTDTTLRTQTIRDIRACLEDEADQGWINSYSLLLTPPIQRSNGDVEYWDFSDVITYDSDEGLVRDFGGAKFGGANNVRLKVPVKIPEPGDKLDTSASGRTAAEADNYNPDGEYYLHVAIFDRCWSPTLGSPDYLEVKGYELKLQEPSGEEATEGVCCTTGNWPFRTKFTAGSVQECRNVFEGTVKEDWELNQCTDAPPELASGSCFRPESLTGGYTAIRDISHTASSARQCTDEGGYSTEAQAREAANVAGQPSTRCFSNRDVIETDDGVEFRMHTIYGTDTCDDVTNYYSELSREIVEEEGLSVTECYVCDASGAGYDVIAEDDGEEKWFKITGDARSTCEKQNAVTLEQAEAGACNLGVGAVEHPTDSDRWCYVQEGMTTEEACAEDSFLKKDHLKIGELDHLDIIMKDHTRTFVRSWDEVEEIPIVSADIGGVACKEGSTFVRAMNTDVREYRDNKLVFDAIDEYAYGTAFTTWVEWNWDFFGWFFTGDRSKDKMIEKTGVCITDETDLWTEVRMWVGDLLDVEYDEPIVLVVIIAGVLFIFVIISQAMKPPRPRQPQYGGY